MEDVHLEPYVNGECTRRAVARFGTGIETGNSESFPRDRPIHVDRVGFVDFLRGFAIVLMVLVHTAKGILDSTYRVSVARPEFSFSERLAVSVQSFLLTTEPYVSALFLTLVGFSMVLVSSKVREKGVSGWRLRRLRTAVKLTLISWVIFWVHGGIQWPYPFFSAEILYTIALGIVTCMWLLPLSWAPAKNSPDPGVQHDANCAVMFFPWRIVGLAAAFAVACGVTAYAESVAENEFGLLAQGPGAHFPNIAFVFLGALLGAVHTSRTRLFLAGIPIVGLLILIFYHVAIIPELQAQRKAAGLTSGPITAIFDAPTGRTTVERAFVTGGSYGSVYDLQRAAAALGLLEDAPPPKIVKRCFWTKKVILVPYLAGLMFLTFGVAWWPRWASLPFVVRRVVSPLILMGRTSLFLYVFHLALIALAVVVLGRSTLSPSATAFGAVVILTSCVCAARAVRGWFPSSRLTKRTRVVRARKA